MEQASPGGFLSPGGRYVDNDNVDLSGNGAHHRRRILLRCLVPPRWTSMQW